MIWRLFLMVMLSGALSSCHRKDVGQLPNGHKVWAMNPVEIYVANSKNELLVGYAISRIGVSGDFVVVECAALEGSRNSFSNMPGLSVVNTKTDIVYRNLEYARAEMLASGVNFDDVVMSPVSEHF